jgi:hypothetical protein
MLAESKMATKTFSIYTTAQFSWRIKCIKIRIKRIVNAHFYSIKLILK